jgi:serine/threonine-protein kinase
MGEVWRAHDTATNRIVAIKLLPPQLAADETFVQRFRREAEAAAQLNNPHIIPIHNYGEIDGRLYVDMRLIEGRDLAEVLAEGPLPPELAVRIIGQVATALRAAHKIGLVHRDVKPSNILLDEDSFAYLIDFGIARGADHTSLTGTGAIIGSWHYMAPERMSAREADARADIYALACVLYECLTGSRPFPGTSMESQVAAHLTEPPPRPSATQPKVPAAFDAVIAKGMAKEPGQRYQTVTDLSTAAQQAPTVPARRPDAGTAPTVFDYPDTPPPQRPPDPQPQPRQSASRRRRIAITLIVTTVALLVAGTMLTVGVQQVHIHTANESSIRQNRYFALSVLGFVCLAIAALIMISGFVTVVLTSIRRVVSKGVRDG